MFMCDAYVWSFTLLLTPYGYCLMFNKVLMHRLKINIWWINWLISLLDICNCFLKHSCVYMQVTHMEVVYTNLSKKRKRLLTWLILIHPPPLSIIFNSFLLPFVPCLSPGLRILDCSLTLIQTFSPLWPKDLHSTPLSCPLNIPFSELI